MESKNAPQGSTLHLGKTVPAYRPSQHRASIAPCQHLLFSGGSRCAHLALIQTALSGSQYFSKIREVFFLWKVKSNYIFILISNPEYYIFLLEHRNSNKSIDVTCPMVGILLKGRSVVYWTWNVLCNCLHFILHHANIFQVFTEPETKSPHNFSLYLSKLSVLFWSWVLHPFFNSFLH